MFQEKSQILWNEPVGDCYYSIGLTCHEEYSLARPGQFITLRFVDQIAPLLRRPFSIHNLIQTKVRTQGIELLYKVVGTCTQKLSAYKKGDVIDLLGPLGNGFLIPDTARRVFIVAGGIGVAPLAFLASSMKKKGADISQYQVFIGGRSRGDLLCDEYFSAMGMPVHLTTDDGSDGEKGLVTTPLERAIRQNPPDMMCACGPAPMLKAVAHIAEIYAVPCQISVETLMACGMGVCLGCAVEDKSDARKYLHVCADGPVFDVKVLKTPAC